MPGHGERGWHQHLLVCLCKCIYQILNWIMEKDEKIHFLPLHLTFFDWGTLVYTLLYTSNKNEEDIALAGCDKPSIAGQYISTVDIESSWHEKLK